MGVKRAVACADGDVDELAGFDCLSVMELSFSPNRYSTMDGSAVDKHIQSVPS
jgi:hypothetical protein